MHETDDGPPPGSASMRVEELARRCGVSVDTVRYYQKRGLLQRPLRLGRVALYGPAHAERVRRIREMQAEGLRLSLIARMLDAADPATAPLPSAPALDASEERLDLAALSARSGVPVQILEACELAGVLVPRDFGGVGGYTASDIEAVRIGLGLLDFDFPIPALFALAEELAPAVHGIADRCVEMFDTHVRGPILADESLDEEAKAERVVAAFRVLLPAATRLVAHHFQRVLVNEGLTYMAEHGTDSEIRTIEEHSAKRYEVTL